MNAIKDEIIEHGTWYSYTYVYTDEEYLPYHKLITTNNIDNNMLLNLPVGSQNGYLTTSDNFSVFWEWNIIQ